MATERVEEGPHSDIPDAVRKLSDMHVTRVQAAGFLLFSGEQRVRCFVADVETLDMSMKVTGRTRVAFTDSSLQEAQDWVKEHPETDGIRTELVQSNLLPFTRAAGLLTLEPQDAPETPEPTA